MMAIFEGLNWQALSSIAVVFSAFFTAVAWTFNKVYRVGTLDQKIIDTEHTINVEFREKFHEIDRRFACLDDKLEKRFDKIDERFKEIDAKFDKLYNLLLKKQ